MDGLVDGRKDEWVKGWMDGLVGKWMDCFLEGWMGGGMDGMWVEE